MKKRFLTLITFILVLIMSASVFSACDLITVNNERDMNQVVATVTIGDGAPTETINKKDMVMAYLNYGYYYVSQYGYTVAQAFELIIESLVQNRLFVQIVMKEFNESGLVENDTLGVWEVERYLTTIEILDAEYNTVKGFNDIIDSYEEEDDEEEEETETSTEEVRTVPTDAANKEEELTDTEKQDYVNDGVDKDSSTERKAAYNQFLKALESNSLLGSDFDFETGDLTKTDYYKDYKTGEEESILLDNWQKKIEKDARATINLDTLKDNYTAMYNAQKTSYEVSATDFSTAVSAATASNPILYTPYTGYGYVYNVLIGVDDVQSALIADIDSSLSTADYYKQRQAILSMTTAKDLRSTWITSGYDFDYATKKFTGDYAFLDDSLDFKGEVTWLNESEKDDKDYTAEYRVDSVRTYGLDEFVALVEDYVYGATQTDTKTADEINYFKKVETTTAKDNYDERINELLFAFSTDSGSLNTFKGYSITPAADIGQSETYVKEFAKAGAELLDMGGKSYIAVATDYGYHFMFYSQLLSVSTSYENLTDYLDTLDATKGGFTSWEEYYTNMLNTWDDFEDTTCYLYLLQDMYSSTLVSSALTNRQNEILAKYMDNESYVNIYADRYADLSNS